jgi:vacuolar-type H+-ATPase subunit E/Vma4
VLKTAFEKFAEKVKLSDSEEGGYNKIKHAIDNPNDYKDKTPVAFNKDDLATLFNLEDVNDALFNK